MKKNVKIYTIAGAFVILTALFATGVFAMPSGIFGHQGGPGQYGQNNASLEIRNAIAAGDFGAFQNAVTTYNITWYENTTQDQFNNLVTAYQNRIQTQADMNQTRTDINNAIKSNDYAGWKQAMTDWFNRFITQDAFNKLVGRYNNSTNSTNNMMGWHFGGYKGNAAPRGPGFMPSGQSYASYAPGHMRGRGAGYHSG